MSSTDPRARQAYLRLGYGAPSAERLEILPALGRAVSFGPIPGASDSAPLALAPWAQATPAMVRSRCCPSSAR
jgi:hypothetical protein